MRKFFVLTGPSGVGKTTLRRAIASQLQSQFGPKSLKEVCSVTTRPPRLGELPGVDYEFISQEQGDLYLNDGRFFEHVHYDGNLYGVLNEWFEDSDSSTSLILVMERMGLEKLQQAYPQHTVGILLVPPTLDDLATRLRQDGREERVIKRRLATAEDEICRDILMFDHVLVNKNLDHTLHYLKQIILTETAF